MTAAKRSPRLFFTMSQPSRTDDDIGVKRPRSSAGTPQQREWIRNVLGINIETLVALDLQTTTTQQSADQAAPVLLHQVMEITAPLKTLPHAETPQLETAVLSIKNIRDKLGGKPTPQVIIAMRREVDALAALVKAAADSVTQLQQRRQAVVEKARALAYTKEAKEDSEGALIKEFQTQQASVAGAFANGPLTGKQVETAEIALQAASSAVEQIANAVQERLGRRLAELVLAAGKLAYSKDADEKAEGEPIGRFKQQRDAVGVAKSKTPLANLDIQQAEESLQQATDTAKAIDEAVEKRHAAWADKIRERADTLMKGITVEGVDPTCWSKPKATREQIDKELVSS